MLCLQESAVVNQLYPSTDNSTAKVSTGHVFLDPIVRATRSCPPGDSGWSVFDNSSRNVTRSPLIGPRLTLFGIHPGRKIAGLLLFATPCLKNWRRKCVGRRTLIALGEVGPDCDRGCSSSSRKACRHSIGSRNGTSYADESNVSCPGGSHSDGSNHCHNGYHCRNSHDVTPEAKPTRVTSIDRIVTRVLIGLTRGSRQAGPGSRTAPSSGRSSG